MLTFFQSATPIALLIAASHADPFCKMNSEFPGSVRHLQISNSDLGDSVLISLELKLQLENINAVKIIRYLMHVCLLVIVKLKMGHPKNSMAKLKCLSF
jgi:hypothetical protein